MRDLSNDSLVSYEDYLELRKRSEHMWEYVDGVVYMSPSPSTKH